MNKGIYFLLIHLPRKAEWPVAGKRRVFAAGYYGYVGSAMNSLSGRLGRHLRTSQPRHWHIDGLLSRGRVIDVQIRFTEDSQAECRLASEVAAWPEAQRIDGFGASDCGCATHLSWFRRRPGESIRADTVAGHLNALFASMEQRYIDYAAQDREPFATLAKCILSLRTRDPVTDKAAERLFKTLRTPQEMAASDPEQVSQLIYPVGMYRQKARRLKQIGQILVDEYGGRVPDDIERLLQLPGVGRKTANLVRSFAFHKPAICVDTHVHRITNRWGLLRSTAPDETEQLLRRRLPERFWQPINGYLVQHGQQICRPQRPQCDDCPLRFGCQYDDLRAERAVLETAGNAPDHPCLGRGVARHP